MKQLEVTIMGQSYLLGCSEGGEMSLLEAVEKVDREMCAIRDVGKVKARERIAVLAALNIAYELAAREREAPAPTDDRGISANEARLDALIRRLDQALASVPSGHVPTR